jgi:hypothetical protein
MPPSGETLGCVGGTPSPLTYARFAGPAITTAEETDIDALIVLQRLTVRLFLLEFYEFISCCIFSR